MSTDEHNDFLTRERVVYVLESLNPSTGPEWVVEDYYSAADLAEEQRAWIAPRYTRSQFRVVVYRPETADT